MTKQTIIVLRLKLHHLTVGYLSGFQHGRNIFTFSKEFKHDDNRATLSLVTQPTFPNVEKVLSKQWISKQRLHPIFSNLLPEGAMREFIAQGLKIHPNNEFKMFSYLGSDLPGALIAKAITPDQIPDYVLNANERSHAVTLQEPDNANKFSLAGIQFKFSMKEKDGRYSMGVSDTLGDWIIKTPSSRYRDVPLNEYTSMQLAEIVGIDVPETKLINLSQIEGLPPINLPAEQYAYAIKRFDRYKNERIHMEDFAQVLVKYPEQKYGAANYEQIGRIISTYSGDGIADAQQFARRLLVNILLANGDAHLKNWSLVYQDKITARLSPAYDILMTSVYIEDEQHFALNLAKNKNWFNASMAHFKVWSEKSNVPWRSIKPHLDDVMARARTLWPDALKDSPMADVHKLKLKQHLKKLHSDFKVEIL